MFISFLHHRNKGHAVISFDRLSDIESHLLKQWGSLFQKPLREQREGVSESRKMFTIFEQIEDIKTAIISTIGNAHSRKVARGVIKYLSLADFLSGLQLPNRSLVMEKTIPFDELLNEAGIIAIRDIPGARATLGRSALIKSDGTSHEMRFPRDYVTCIGMDWASFAALGPDVREIIFDTISDMGYMGPGLLRYRAEQFEEYFAKQLGKEEIEELSMMKLLVGSNGTSEGEG